MTINGPAAPGITIDDGREVQVMQVASGTELNLNHLTIANAATSGEGGGIFNEGTLAIQHCTFLSRGGRQYSIRPS